MEQFSYYFISTMLHSFWQAAVLLLFYGIILLLKPRLAPLNKRNILLSLVAIQGVYSMATFYLLATNATQGLLVLLANSVTPLLTKSLLQENAYLIFLSYLLFVAGRILSNCWQWNQFKKGYKKSLLKAPLDLRLFTRSTAFEFGITRKVSLWCSNNISTPMTFGFWKPVILLPVALVSQLSLQQVEALIIHELTHIRHKDYILNLGLVITETIFFFNPFIRFIAKQIKMEREKTCDVQVLNFKYGHILYAEALLKASQIQQQLSLQITAVKSKKQLFERISFFTNSENLAFQQSHRRLIVAGYVCTVLLTMLLAVTFTQKKTGYPLPIEFQRKTLTTAPIFTNETTPVFQIQAAVARPIKATVQKPITIKATNKIDAVRKEITEEVDLLADDAAGFHAMAASSTETNLEGKEIIIKEEGSDGKKITAAYYALLVDGLWTLQPLWLISETRPTADSMQLKRKDSLINLLPTAQ